MSIAVVDCAVWHEISKLAKQEIEKKHSIQLVQRPACSGFSEQNRVSVQCLACSNFFKNKVKAEIKVKVV